jgi:hypothetical protein
VIVFRLRKNIQYVLCVKVSYSEGCNTFEFEGVNFSALAIYPKLSVLKNCITNGEKIAMVRFYADKNFKQLCARDKHFFVAWAK